MVQTVWIKELLCFIISRLEYGLIIFVYLNDIIVPQSKLKKRKKRKHKHSTSSLYDSPSKRMHGFGPPGWFLFIGEI